MPKEQQKRGRRGEKRKHLEHDQSREVAPPPSRRQRLFSDELERPTYAEGFSNYADLTSNGASSEVPFYGLLDEEEQAYFKRADTLLELDQFVDADERCLFLDNVYREASGKELKIANSQSCSRFMERLIRISTPEQLKALFKQFSGHFLNLVQHRFASHCCETLFIQAAPLITHELTGLANEVPSERDYIPMDRLYLSAIKELEGSLGYLITDRFASHTLRILLLVLSGRPLLDTTTLAVLQSKKKEAFHIGVWTSGVPSQLFETRSVPESFGSILDHVVFSTIAGLDTTFLHALAMHPTGNPVLQLLLELEFSRTGRAKAQDANSLIRRLLPDDPPVDGTESSSFFNSLLYDAIGSRLLETIVQHAPGKLFKGLYKHLIRDRLATIAKNEVAGFVIIKILERLSREDLEYAVEKLLPLLPLLLERSRTSIIKVMIERCQVRGLGTAQLAEAIQATCGGTEHGTLFSMLKLDAANAEGMSEGRKSWSDNKASGRVHASLLVQAMVASPGPLRNIIMDNIIKMRPQSLLAMEKDRTTTHIIQHVLICTDQAKPFRRKIIQDHVGHLAEMALDPIASHVIDAFWTATKDMLFIREAVAEELLRSEPALRESSSGRAVWRKWKLDLYKRRRVEWIVEAKGLSGSSSVGDSDKTPVTGIIVGSTKSAIQLARERFAAANG